MPTTSRTQGSICPSHSRGWNHTTTAADDSCAPAHPARQRAGRAHQVGQALLRPGRRERRPRAGVLRSPCPDVLQGDPAGGSGVLEDQGPNSHGPNRMTFTSVEDIERQADVVTAYVSEAIAVEQAGTALPGATGGGAGRRAAGTVGRRSGAGRRLRWADARSPARAQPARLRREAGEHAWASRRQDRPADPRGQGPARPLMQEQDRPRSSRAGAAACRADPLSHTRGSRPAIAPRSRRRPRRRRRSAGQERARHVREATPGRPRRLAPAGRLRPRTCRKRAG